MSAIATANLYHGTTTGDPLVATISGAGYLSAANEENVIGGTYLAPQFDLAAFVAAVPANGLDFLLCITCDDACGDPLIAETCTPLVYVAQPPQAAIDSATVTGAGIVEFDMSGSTTDPACDPIQSYTIHVFDQTPTLLQSVTNPTQPVTVDYGAIAAANPPATVNDLTAVGEVQDACGTDSTNDPQVDPPLFPAYTIPLTDGGVAVACPLVFPLVYNGNSYGALSDIITAYQADVGANYVVSANADGCRVDILQLDPTDPALTEVPVSAIVPPTIATTPADNGDGTFGATSAGTSDPNCAPLAVSYEIYDSADCTGTLITTIAGTIDTYDAVTGAYTSSMSAPFDYVANAASISGCEVSIKAIVSDNCGQSEEDCSVTNAVQIDICNTHAEITDEITGALPGTLDIQESGAALAAGGTFDLTINGEAATFNADGTLNSGAASWLAHITLPLALAGTTYSYTLNIRDWQTALGNPDAEIYGADDLAFSIDVTTANGCTASESTLTETPTGTTPDSSNIRWDISGIDFTVDPSSGNPPFQLEHLSVAAGTLSWDQGLDASNAQTALLRPNLNPTVNWVGNLAGMLAIGTRDAQIQCFGDVANYEHGYELERITGMSQGMTLDITLPGVTSLADITYTEVNGVATMPTPGVLRFTANVGIAGNTAQINDIRGAGGVHIEDFTLGNITDPLGTNDNGIPFIVRYYRTWDCEESLFETGC